MAKAPVTPYINRELSWLKFNERVLEEAEDRSVPLFERLKFVEIFINNLTEFYMVRVGGLRDQELVDGLTAENKTNMTPTAQLAAIAKAVAKLIPRKDAAYAQILSSLRRKGIEIATPQTFTVEDTHYLSAFFKTELSPLLSPFIVDKNHPFPFLKGEDLYVALSLAAKGSKSFLLGVIPVNPRLGRYVALPGGDMRICLIEDVLLMFAGKVFKKYDVLEKTVIRVTRNADIDIAEALFDEDMDFRDVMSDIIRERKKLAAVRLELGSVISPEFTKYLQKKLAVPQEHIYVNHSPLELKFVYSMEAALKRRGNAALFFPPFSPRAHVLEPSRPIIEQLLEKDTLLFYPYDAMSDYIRLINEAAADPYVLSIKITLYRVASSSKVVAALINAAEAGKDVYAMVELRARFDEENNISWAKRLEEAGVTLSYGLDEYKTHSKVTLITRRTPDELQYITQIGTGNYNEKTAALYTDLALMTSDKDLGQDAARFFQDISMGDVPRECDYLLVAPAIFSDRLCNLFDEQIGLALEGKPASVVIKINSLTDKTLIDKIIEASNAGVSVKLIVRGICCLKAGLPGYTENVEIISIVGRFLEHSRIYSFGSGEHQRLYISSGDWMTRSTCRRIEVGVPIFDDDVTARINELLDISLRDNVKARLMLPSGRYVKKKPVGDEKRIVSQEWFMAENKF